MSYIYFFFQPRFLFLYCVYFISNRVLFLFLLLYLIFSQTGVTQFRSKRTDITNCDTRLTPTTTQRGRILQLYFLLYIRRNIVYFGPWEWTFYILLKALTFELTSCITFSWTTPDFPYRFDIPDKFVIILRQPLPPNIQ